MGNIILLLHNDILLTRQAFITMLETLLLGPDIGAVGPLTNECYYSVHQRIRIYGDVTGIRQASRYLQQDVSAVGGGVVIG